MDEFQIKTLVSSIEKEIEYLKIEKVSTPISTLEVYDVFIGYEEKQIDFQLYKDSKSTWDTEQISSQIEEQISQFEYLNNFLDHKIEQAA